MRMCDLCTKFTYSKPRFRMNKKFLMHAQADRDDLADTKIHLSQNVEYTVRKH